MIIGIIPIYDKTGYIAGFDDGIVTVNSVPAVREITVMRATDLHIVQRTQSLANGHYLIPSLDPKQEYLVMVRDYKKEYEPICWDYVVPMMDKTVDELMEIWASWQG